MHSNITVREATHDEVRGLLASGHYLGDSQKCSIWHVAEQDDQIVAIAGYGQPGRRGTAQAFWDVDKHPATIELLRFWTDVHGGTQGSWFMARSLKLLSAEYEMVVSFADPSAGTGTKNGGLYKASNWIDCGETTANEFEYRKDGARISKAMPWHMVARQVDIHDPGERAAYNIQQASDLWCDAEGIEKVCREHKLRFAYPRTKYARKHLRRSSK